MQLTLNEDNIEFGSLIKPSQSIISWLSEALVQVGNVMVQDGAILGTYLLLSI